MPRFSSPPAIVVTIATIVAMAAVEVAAAPFARADERVRPVRDAVHVEPGATCLDAVTLVEHVVTWLGADPVDADLSVDVRGSADRPRVVVFQTLRSGRVIASRRFDPGPERCDHLHAALGLAIAMAMKASLVEEIAGPLAPPPPAPPAAPPAAALPVLPASPPSELSSEPPWALGADALAALAVLPEAAFGLDARVEHTLGPSFGVRFGLLALASLEEPFNGAPRGGFEAWLLAPRVDVCARVAPSSRLRIRGCMGVAVGVIHAHGVDVPSAEGAFVRWIAVANGLDLTADLTRNWSLDAGVTLFLPVARDSIVVRDTAGRVVEERDLASVGGFFGFGPVYRF